MTEEWPAESTARGNGSLQNPGTQQVTSAVHPGQDLRKDANELTPEIWEGTGLRADRQGDGGSPRGARAVLAQHSGVGGTPKLMGGQPMYGGSGFLQCV